MPYVTRHQCVYCDCGQRKLNPQRDACERCRYLDGETVTDFELIQVLREVSDGLSAEALSYELRRYREAVHKTLQRLERAGRIMRCKDVEYTPSKRGGRPPDLFRLVDKGRRPS